MSSDDLAISASGLGKDYQLGELTDIGRLLRLRLLRDTAITMRRPELHALYDVTFDVRRGESVGVVGTNGSGKSTLVQIMAGITVPTAGRMEVTGRVLPLLEVGAGFHPELTGRENVTLFGTILGLSREEISAALPAVSDFSQIDTAHMDTPVKRFSTGMRARLSFAIAMCFPADIYIFDEVMAVVDDQFRATAMSEISQLRAMGRTVIFISHDLDQVRNLCDRGIWLHRGRMKMDADMDKVANAYAEAEGNGRDAHPAGV